MDISKQVKERPVRPFSNGTDAMIWTDNNCDRCVKAWNPDPNKPPPSHKTIQEYLRIGKYCRLQNYLDLGWMDGTIPAEIAREIGVINIHYQDNCKEHGFCTLKNQCSKFSDDDNDKFRYPKRVPPDDGNQLVMPFIIDEMEFKENLLSNKIITTEDVNQKLNCST